MNFMYNLQNSCTQQSIDVCNKNAFTTHQLDGNAKDKLHCILHLDHRINTRSKVLTFSSELDFLEMATISSLMLLSHFP